MRVGKTISILGVMVLSVLLSAFPAAVLAGGRPMIRLADMDDGDGNSAIDLTIRQVTVQPVRAYVGDTVDVEVWIENREGGSDTTWAELYAGGKLVGKQMFRWGTPGADRTTRLHIQWDTTGMAPGEYKIKVEAFVFNDTYSFDNDFTVKEPVILAAPGSGFPGGAPAGGSVTEIDPRYK